MGASTLHHLVGVWVASPWAKPNPRSNDCHNTQQPIILWGFEGHVFLTYHTSTNTAKFYNPYFNSFQLYGSVSLRQMIITKYTSRTGEGLWHSQYTSSNFNNSYMVHKICIGFGSACLHSHRLDFSETYPWWYPLLMLRKCSFISLFSMSSASTSTSHHSPQDYLIHSRCGMNHITFI